MAAIPDLIKQPHGTHASVETTVLYFADKSYQGASSQILNFTVSYVEIKCQLDATDVFIAASCKPDA